jgi:hypothetical protein
VESVGETITLLPKVGEPLLLPAAHFQGLLQAGAMRRVTAADPSPVMPELRQALLRASPHVRARSQPTAPSSPGICARRTDPRLLTEQRQMLEPGFDR